MTAHHLFRTASRFETDRVRGIKAKGGLTGTTIAGLSEWGLIRTAEKLAELSDPAGDTPLIVGLGWATTLTQWMTAWHHRRYMTRIRNNHDGYDRLSLCFHVTIKIIPLTAHPLSTRQERPVLVLGLLEATTLLSIFRKDITHRQQSLRVGLEKDCRRLCRHCWPWYCKTERP